MKTSALFRPVWFGVVLASAVALSAIGVSYGQHGGYGHHGHGGHYGHHYGYGSHYGHHGRSHSYRPYYYGSHYYRPYSHAYRYPYSYGRGYGYSPYSYRGSSNYRPDSGSSGTYEGGSGGNTYGSGTSGGRPSGSGYKTASGHGWTLLAQGRSSDALQEFARQAEGNPAHGVPKVGYALASAASGDLSRGVWAMRRACRIDPNSMHNIKIAQSLRPRVQGLIKTYQGGGDQRDCSFMLASLHYLAGDMNSAQKAIDEAIRLGDNNQSAVNMKRVIAQTHRASSTGKTDPAADGADHPPLPPPAEEERPPLPKDAI